MNKLENLEWLKNHGFRVPVFTSNKDIVNTLGISPTIDDGHIDKVAAEVGVRMQNNQFEKISVRSSPTTSMPGILKTVINVPVFNVAAIAEAYKEVLDSYNSRIAQLYRKRNNLPDETFPVVIFQRFIDATVDEESGSGILHTMNPDTGEDIAKVVFKKQAHGEAVVSGGSAVDFADFAKYHLTMSSSSALLQTKKEFPQDVEFCIADDKVWFLQTRDLVFSKDVKDKAIIALYKRFKTERLKNMLPTEIKPDDFLVVKEGTSIYEKLSLVTGLGQGRISEDNNVPENDPFILLNEKLILDETVSYDNCKGIITSEGNELCHAAIIARKYGIPCLLDSEKNLWNHIDEFVTIDGSTGTVYSGKAEIGPSEEYEKLVQELKTI